MKQPSFNPYAALVIGVAAVAASAIFVKLAQAPSGVIAFYRMFFTVLLMTPLFLLKYVQELKVITKRDWIYAVIAGIFLAFHFILWFESLNYTSVASSTVLVTLQPLFAFLGAYYFFKEKISLKTVLSGMIAIAGSVIISWGDFQLSGKALLGDMLALIACGLVTAYLLVGQNLRKRISVITYTYIIYAVSTITLFFYVIAVQDRFFPYKDSDWLYFFLLALIPNLLGHSIFNWALKWVSTSAISMAILFEPVGAAILAYFILNENLMWFQAVGGLIVMMGIGLFVIDEKKLTHVLKRRN